MPDRSVKMKRRIFGFQRRVWWPKCTPASSSSRIEATAMSASPLVLCELLPAGRWRTHLRGEHPRLGLIRRGVDGLGRGKCSEGLAKVVRQLRGDVDPFAGERVVEGQPPRVEELPLQPEHAGPAVRRVAGDREVDRGEVDPDLVGSPRLE